MHQLMAQNQRQFLLPIKALGQQHHRLGKAQQHRPLHRRTDCHSRKGFQLQIGCGLLQQCFTIL